MAKQAVLAEPRKRRSRVSKSFYAGRRLTRPGGQAAVIGFRISGSGFRRPMSDVPRPARLPLMLKLRYDKVGRQTDAEQRITNND